MKDLKYKLDHVALQVENLKRAVKWYTCNLDANIEYMDDTWALIEIGKTSLALTLASQHPPHVAFQVDNIDDIPSDEIKEHRDGSKYAYIKDSEGNVIEFIYWQKDKQ